MATVPRSPFRFPLSEEQAAVVRCPARTVRVSAGAGTGKTGTLEAYALARPNQSFLYVAFNQSIRGEAQRRFPRNVRCQTTHGMAYAEFGKPFEQKLGNPKPYHFVSSLGISMVTAGLVLAGVMRWLYSADPELDVSHFQDVDATERAQLVDFGRRAWRMMCDPGVTSVPQCHDGYLKLFQLSRPKLEADVILFDECQDANAAVLDVIAQQEHCTRIFVGDRRQAIYGFRGAVNAMDLIDAEADLQLTGSFRYGQGIADVANAVLAAYGSNPLQLRGLSPKRTQFTIDTGAPHTIIARTNAGLFSAAVEVLERGQPFGFLGGPGAYRFNALLDADRLRRGDYQSVTDPFLRSFASYGEMKEYAESVEDGELRSLMVIVDRYRGELPALVRQLTDASSSNANRSIVLTTGHRAKGLEWPSVRLWNDFTDMRLSPVDGGAHAPPSDEEINLLYVSITRAKERIMLHDSFLSWLGGHNPALHGAIMNEYHRPALPPRSVSGLDFSAPSLTADVVLGADMRSILRDAPAMIASVVERCHPDSHHVLKMLFDMTYHLATGDLVLNAKGADSAASAPVISQTAASQVSSERRVRRAQPDSVAEIDAREVLPLWMLGRPLDAISEQVGKPLDSVAGALARALGVKSSDIVAQNTKRSVSVSDADLHQ